MIMIINKLIALLPNPRQEVFHTQGMAFRGSARSRCGSSRTGSPSCWNA